jgi:hypothetical protein
VRQKLFVQAVAANLPRDKVVPPEQALAMVEALRQKKLAVADVAFEHGFRHPMPASKSAVSTWPLPHELSFIKRWAIVHLDYFNTNPFSLLHLTNGCADKDRGAA